MDPKDAAILALRQEVELLRSENVYLRDQVGPISMPSLYLVFASYQLRLAHGLAASTSQM